jgi:putative NADPH-quinone reductase
MNFFSEYKKKTIVLLLGHPDSVNDTLSKNLALIYETSAKAAGHTVVRFNLFDMHFDPILHQGYRAIQNLEPDLIQFQQAIKACDHFVLIYPTWWSAMPAPLKGLFDRVWLPSFAFSMRKHKDGTPALGWKKLLKGKTARVITLSRSHPWALQILFGDYTNEISRALLWFAGMRVRMTKWGPSEKAPEWLKNSWRRKVAHLGKMGE